MKKAVLSILFITTSIFILAACHNEGQLKENQKGEAKGPAQEELEEDRIKDTKDIAGKLPEFTSMEMPSIKKSNTEGLNGLVFDNVYTEVCWNDCDEHNTYNYPDIHSGDVETGDELLIDWHKMKPLPTEINFLQINTENNQVIKKESKDMTNTPLEIEVDEEKIGSQYALEFVWKEGNETKGRSMLNFKLE